MISQRITSKIPSASNKFRYRVRIVSDPCPNSGKDYDKTYFGLLQNMINDPTLCLCKDQSPLQTKIEYINDHIEITFEREIVEEVSENLNVQKTFPTT